MSDTPADRFGHLFELINDPVVEIRMVDHEPIIEAVNPAFETVFGYDREAVLGESLNEFIVPEDDTNAERFDRRTAAGKHNTGLVTRETASGPREFLYRGVPYERDGEQYGFSIYTDVSEQRRYERHLQVVHRLLRHDLRNNLQVVDGAATQVLDRTDDPEIVRLAERIHEHARRLGTVGEETRLIERVLFDDHDPTTVDVADASRTAVGRVRSVHTEVALTTDLPETLPVTGSRWLPDAIEALVENAALHGGEVIDVSVEHDGDRVGVVVADNGEGIPEGERAPVFEGQPITQLRHDSGVGLWLARWVTEACGGHMGYERVDGWTIVRVWVPGAEAATTAADG